MKTTEPKPSIPAPPRLVKQLTEMHHAEQIRKELAQLQRQQQAGNKLNRKQRRALAARRRRGS